MSYATTKKEATFKAQNLADQMGGGWSPDVWQNLGWHYCISSRCKRVKIYPNFDEKSFIAFLSNNDGAGGRFAERGKTPMEALRAVIKRAIAERDELNKLIEIGRSAEVDAVLGGLTKSTP